MKEMATQMAQFQNGQKNKILALHSKNLEQGDIL
jgi:hypothetical protein